MNQLLDNIDIIYQRKVQIEKLEIVKKDIQIKNKSIISRFFSDKTKLKKIGEGWKVSVYANSSEPKYIAKVYENKQLVNLANAEMNMLLHIQKEINLDNFKYVKIPKLVEYDTTDIHIVHIFERVYNIEDTDINNPSEMLHVYITNNPNEKIPQKISGRGKIVTLDQIEKYINESILKEYIYEMGRIFGLLNFKAKVITDDIEIVFGKDSVNDTQFKFYILDFDRVSTLYMSEAKYIDILGRKDYFIFSTLKDIYKNKFYDGYLHEAKLNGFDNIAENELKKIGYIPKKPTATKQNIRAYDGQYVVAKTNSNWVYDVKIHNGTKNIAVVGFTPSNKNGSIFWQVLTYDEEDLYNKNRDSILTAAKSYAVSRGVNI